jgi:hypothetical protein
MSGAARIAAFAVVLALVFAGAALAGKGIDADGAEESSGGHEADAHGAEEASGSHGETAHGADSEPGAASHPVRGLAVAENGLRLVLDETELERGAQERLRFRIVEESDEETVREFDLEHERRMHLIVVRRDLTGFQHLHPEMDSDGTWTVPVRLPDAGSYRVFADFSHEDEPTTLASDMRVDGPAQLSELPAATTSEQSDAGSDVALETASARPGEPSELRFTVTRGGEAVHVDPYLGANGHLVALREGDLAFLHVHPTEHQDEEKGGERDDSIAFEATFPTSGHYRLFLQFKREGRVETAAFTKEVK